MPLDVTRQFAVLAAVEFSGDGGFESRLLVYPRLALKMTLTA